MSKKKEVTPVKISKSQANDLAVVIQRMQINADQVEKNVLVAEKMLGRDAEYQKQGKPLVHQSENAQNLAQAEGLLKDLFLDVDRAGKLQHPQANEIEQDVKNLHDRWAKDCSQYREIYETMLEVELSPRIDWAQVLQEKQEQIGSEQYGPNLSDVEKQIATHNVLHKEIEAYQAQLSPQNSSSQEEYALLKDKYAQLLSESGLRSRYLGSLYEYMQSCGKELAYMSDYQGKILRRDWSDQMVDAPGVRRDYEKFKSNNLLSHESETNQLQETGDRLIEMGHPGSPAVQAHRDAVQVEWQHFLNLCIAQEAHLDNIEAYKKFQLDTETLAESLKRLDANLSPKVLANRSNPEVLMALEGDEPEVQRNQQRLAALKDLSKSIAPLRLRRTTPPPNTPILSLCDWADQEDSVTRGDKLTLKSNVKNDDWEVQTSSGKTKTLPGACFMIPPPDSEAVDRVNSLNEELTDLKKRRSAMKESIKASSSEIINPQNAAEVDSPPENLRAVALAEELDKVMEGLEKSQRDVTGRVSSPLDRKDPVRDLENRLKEHENSAVTLKSLESKLSGIQREMDPILADKPLGPVASILPWKLSSAHNQLDDITALSDLYRKKAGASMFLERQIQKMGGVMSGLEERLAADRAIPDAPGALKTRGQLLQALSQDVSSQQEAMQALGRDLELTELQCSSLQKSFSKFCPDILRQEKDVKQLKNRYANIKGQLQDRSSLVKEATNKNQAFDSAAQSLDFFLVNLPNNKIQPTDDLAQITSKQNAQQRVVEDLKKKSEDLGRVRELSRELQSTLNEYEIKSDMYRGTLRDDEDDDDDENDDQPPLKRRQTSTMAKAVAKQERALLNLYSEASAENNQLLDQMGMAKNIISKNEEKANQIVVKQQLQLQSQQKGKEQTDSLKKELNEEIVRRSHAENDLETFRTRYMSLKSRRGVERLEEKEVVQYYRDPKLEVEIESQRRKIKDDASRRSEFQMEINIINEKVMKLQTELTNIEPKLVTKVLTEYERDPQLDKEAERIREEIRRLKMEVQTRQSETVHIKTELTVLEQKKPKIKEKVVKKEVVRLEKDPEMLRAVLTFQSEIADEGSRSQNISDDIFHIRSEINTLERTIPSIQPKIVTKVVKKVEQDKDLLEESKKLRVCLDEEKDENIILTKDLTKLQLRYSEVERLKPKVEVKEIINETYRVDPETEMELIRLRKDLKESSRNRANTEKEISSLISELSSLRSQKPKVEYKEVTQEVIKEEKSPEIIRELQRLQNQVNRLQVNCDTTLELLTHLRQERDGLKTEKSKIETKIVNRDEIKYENDPLLEKEADRLRRDVREEVQKRRLLEESIFDLQNKYIGLERQKPEEKIVKHEVIRLEKDPNQILEHEKLNKNLDEEVKARRKLELEVKQLRTLVEEKEATLSMMDDRQKKIQVETELRQIRTRIRELEIAPPPIEERIIIEEVLKVERDPQLDKLTDDLRANMETESTNISRLEREIRNLKIQLEILQKEKKIEKVVYKEVVRVEKDPAVEAEREHLRELVQLERNQRRDKEDELQNFNTKIIRLQTVWTTSSQEENSLTQSRDNLKREKESLLKELSTLEGERRTISMTFQQQSKLMSERNQLCRQRSLKMESEITRLEREILREKDKLHQRETLIAELQNNLTKEDHTETRTRETNLSTTITIMDPATGKDMSPYDAYLEGLIDRNQYIRLQELECDWEEISSTGPDGETSILQDRKSGKQFSINKAVQDGRLTQYDLQRYKDGKMHISEFALLVAGDFRPKTFVPPLPSPKSPKKAASTSSLNSMSSSLNFSYNSLTNLNSSSSTSLTLSATDELFPISGILDTTTDSRMSVRSALTRKLIDTDTALKLLEAQAATGGIIDLSKKDKLSVHKAAERGFIDSTHMYKLLNAQKAFTGVEDPVTKERLSAGQAAEKGWIPQDSAKRFMEAQYLTGGLVNPQRAGRVSVKDAIASKLIDEAQAKELEDESSYTKELVDPISKAKISYKQAMDLCRRDVNTGLLLLPVASTDATDAPSYSNYRFNRGY